MNGVLFDNGEMVEITWNQYLMLVWTGKLDDDCFVMKTPDQPETQK